MTGNDLADRYLDRYERLVEQRSVKASSLGTATQAMKTFRATFGHRPVRSITPVEAEDWVQTVPAYVASRVVALFNYALRMRIVEHNPFSGLGGDRGRGRADQDPPTLRELERLRDACDALGDYADQMRDLVDFLALTLLRPGEAYELRWSDIDVVHNRIHVSRRIYKGVVDTPKSGRAKTIALVPPARVILMRQPTRTRDDGLVFVSKRGQQLNASTIGVYWGQVTARAGLGRDMPLYLASKHAGVHALFRLGLSARALAAQAGWSERSVDDLLAVYAHKDLAALAEVDALYADNADSMRVER
jgi:integrase